MKGKGVTNGPTASDDVILDAWFGDYGRADRPMLTASRGENTIFSFEFATPDDARALGERLFALARKSEEKAGQRGPEYRAKLAREEAVIAFNDLVKRFETAMGVDGPNEGLVVMPSPFKEGVT